MIGELGGRSLLHHYGNKSLCELLQAVYPDITWDSGRFTRDRGIWNDGSMQRDFFDKIRDILGIKRWEDWYAVTAR